MFNETRKINGAEVSPIPETAVEALALYAPLVKSRALKYVSGNVELDDLIQEGSIGFLTAYLRYRAELSGFTTFAVRCIDSAIIDYLRRQNKNSQIPDELVVDIDDFDIADRSVNIENSLAVKDEYRKMLDKAHSVLSEIEFSVFSDLLRGYTNREIAVRCSLSGQAVNNAVQRIRRKLK